MSELALDQNLLNELSTQHQEEPRSHQIHKDAIQISWAQNDNEVREAQQLRYKEDNPVTASNLRDFVGTLEVNGVNKGVFMTTSRFPRDSENVISKTQKSIVLIDGPKLVNLMIEYNVGVSTIKTILVKRIDNDFFLDE